MDLKTHLEKNSKKIIRKSFNWIKKFGHAFYKFMGFLSQKLKKSVILAHKNFNFIY